MNALGIYTGLDMRNQTLEFMSANFGKSGAYYYWISRGVDERPVRADRIRKSIGAETTFSRTSPNSTRWSPSFEPLVDKVWRHCEATGNRGPHRHSEGQICRLSRSSRAADPSPAPVAGRDDLERLACGLLEVEMPLPKRVRLLGVSLSALQMGDDAEPQLTFGI